MPKYVENNTNNFSFTKKLYDYMGNEEWKTGYNELARGDVPLLPNGAIDLANCNGYGALWTFLSASFENIGNDIYAKIYNYVENIRDVETCNIHALTNLSKELGIDNISIQDIKYPIEIENLVNIFSISKSYVLLSSYILNDVSLDNIYASDGTIITTGLFSGYDTTSNYWSDSQLSNIETLSSEYTHITLSGYIDYMEAQFSACILEYITKDGIINDIKATGDTTNYLDVDPDTDDIEAKKVEYAVDKNFHVKLEANRIEEGLTHINDYKPNQQLLIDIEFENRKSEQKYGDVPETFRKNKDIKLRKVKNYINFVENLNIYNSEALIYNTFSESYDVLSGGMIGFFDTDSISASLIGNTVHILRNICLKTAYQREYLRRFAQKTALVGTSRIIKDSISEYIARYMSSPDYWGYYSFPGIESPTTEIENLPVVRELSSNLLGDIKVVEYYDTTDYMNISAITDDMDGNVGIRYWEGEYADTFKLMSEHSDEEINEFYNNLGIYLDNNELNSFLDTIYDLGAVSATVNPTFETIPYTLELTGAFGDYGLYQVVSASPSSLYISGDIAPTYEWQELSAFSSEWYNSALLSGNYTSAEIYALWVDSPYVSTFIYDLDFDTASDPGNVTVTNSEFNYSNLDSVSAWIRDTYGVSGWVTNYNTNIWKQSPLIVSWTIEDFEQAWADNPAVSYWTSFDSVTGTTNNFGWDNNPQVIDYARALGKTSVDQITTSQWASSVFVKSWVDEPFDVGIIDIDFNKDEDWAVSSNPFVSGWIDNPPFQQVLSNIDSITGDTLINVDELTIKYALATSGIIEYPSGGIADYITDDLSALVSGSLSGMHTKYLSETSGVFAPANIKNFVHPTVAYIPFLYNLIRSTSDKIVFEKLYSIYNTNTETTISSLSSMIYHFGNTINHWRNDHIDYTGYQTYYEFATNLDSSGDKNKLIDQDGPYHATALEEFLENCNEFMDDFDDHYGHLNLTSQQEFEIKQLLSRYADDIRALSTKTIYQYGVDRYQNHYILFKDNDEFDTPGTMWMRYRNHPLPFPLTSDYKSTDIQQIISNNILNLETFSANCYDFGILTLGTINVIWLYGGDSSIAGTVVISHINIDVAEQRIKFEPLPFNKYIIDVPDNEKYIGVYQNYNDFIVVTLQAMGTIPNYLEYTNSKYYARFKFNVYNTSSGTKLYYTRTPVKYNEYIDYNDLNYNQWKLTLDNDRTLSIAYECSIPELFYGSNGKGFYDHIDNKPLLYNNGIGVLDFNVSYSKTYGHTPIVDTYYRAYTKVTYIGINTNDGIDTTVANYNSTNNTEFINFQYFGNINTSGYVIINNDDSMMCYTSGDLLGIKFGTSTSGDYVDDHIFTTPNEEHTYVVTEPFGEKTYNIKYNGSDITSHLFTVNLENYELFSFYVWEDDDARIFENEIVELLE